MDTIFTFPSLLHYRVPVSPGGRFYTHLMPLFLCLEPFLVCAVATQRTLTDELALVARRACVPGPHGTVTVGDIVFGRLLYPGYRTDKKAPRLSVKETYMLVLEF